MTSSTHILKVSRLEGLTDGIFAIAMTILVLDLRLPVGAAMTNLGSVLRADIYLKLFIYIGSFIILGTLWVAMNFQIGLLERLNRPYLWTNVFYLMIICVVPFSANLIGTFPNSTTSIYFFAANLLCANFAQLITSQCAHYYNLNKETYTPAIRKAVLQRIAIAPIFYISAMFLAHWNIKIAFIVLIAPIIIYLIPGKVDHFDQ